MVNAISKRKAIRRRRLRRQIRAGLILLILGGSIWQWGLPALLDLPCWVVDRIDLGTCPSELRLLVGTRATEVLGDRPLYDIWWHRNQVRADLEALPAVRTVQLHLAWPNRVALTVTPRTPLFVVASGEHYYPVDQYGFLLAKELSPRALLPVVSGLKQELRGVGQTLPPSIVQPVLECLAAAQKWEVHLDHLALSWEEAIDPSGNSARQGRVLILQLRTAQNEGVFLGPAWEVSRKLGLFAWVRQELLQQGKAFEYVDVSLPQAPAWKPHQPLAAS